MALSALVRDSPTTNLVCTAPKGLTLPFLSFFTKPSILNNARFVNIVQQFVNAVFPAAPAGKRALLGSLTVE